MPILDIKKKSIMSVLASLQKTIPGVQILLASCFIGICAQVKIPLYFTPVPLTIQTTAIMIVATLLGSRKGALAALCYLMQGWLGLPVWAGGASGLLHFMGPTGGYLIGYVFQAYFIGWVLEKKSRHSLIKIASTLVISIFMQLAIGSLWLAHYVGINQCLLLGFYPFILSEVAKSLLLSFYLKIQKNRTPCQLK